MPKANGKKVTSTSMTKWDAELAKMGQQASALVNEIGGGGQFLSIKGGILKTAEGVVPNNKINVVILDQIMENDFYTGKFDADTPVSPGCYAFGRTLSEMRPHPDCTDPQHEQCKGCPQNQFGSMEGRKGKACQNRIRMALITESDLADVASAQVRYLKIPPTNLAVFRGYVNQLNSSFNRPPFGAITEITVGPDAKTQVTIAYKLVKLIEDGPVVGDLFTKHEAVKKEIDFAYPVVQPDNGEAKAGKPVKKPKFTRK